jgi:hypothetical protein
MKAVEEKTAPSAFRRAVAFDEELRIAASPTHSASMQSDTAWVLRVSIRRIWTDHNIH